MDAPNTKKKVDLEATLILRIDEDRYDEVLPMLMDNARQTFGDEGFVTCSVMDRDWAEYQRKRDAFNDSFWSRTQEAGVVVFYVVMWLVVWPFARWFAPKPPKNPYEPRD